jgi:hypothetical protein
MRFILPNLAEFEIPDRWWDATGMNNFVPRSEAFRFRTDDDHPELRVNLVDIGHMEPFSRLVELDFGGFSREKMECILRGLVADVPIPPIRAYEKTVGLPYSFGLHDGYHRYYASIAAGFKKIPIVFHEGWWRPRDA